MRCEDISLKLPDYLAGKSDPAERVTIEKHLEGCPACLSETEGLASTWRLLGDIPLPAPDSAALRTRIDASIERERFAASRAPAARRFQWNHPLVAGLAASLVLAIGVLLGRSTETVPAASPDVAALHQELRDLRQMVTLSLMQQQSASERLRGVGFSSNVDGPGDEIVVALLDTLKHDANVNVRLASVDALKRFAERDVVRRAAVDALDTQNSPLVQMALIDFVVETKDRAAIGTLRRISADPSSNETVRTRAAWGIEHLGVES
ncbi:MAG: zf-HC2 domain-containing protein [Pseudomonadota bacterium]